MTIYNCTHEIAGLTELDRIISKLAHSIMLSQNPPSKNRPHIIAVDGYMGSGKSRIWQAFAKAAIGTEATILAQVQDDAGIITQRWGVDSSKDSESTIIHCENVTLSRRFCGKSNVNTNDLLQEQASVYIFNKKNPTHAKYANTRITLKTIGGYNSEKKSIRIKTKEPSAIYRHT
jgi:hypothetical protein